MNNFKKNVENLFKGFKKGFEYFILIEGFHFLLLMNSLVNKTFMILENSNIFFQDLRRVWDDKIVVSFYIFSFLNDGINFTQWNKSIRHIMVLLYLTKIFFLFNHRVLTVYFEQKYLHVRRFFIIFGIFHKYILLYHRFYFYFIQEIFIL